MGNKYSCKKCNLTPTHTTEVVVRGVTRNICFNCKGYVTKIPESSKHKERDNFGKGKIQTEKTLDKIFADMK